MIARPVIIRQQGSDGMTEAIVRWNAPTTPDATAIHLLHRGHDGTISFHRKSGDEKGFGLASLPATDLVEVFPQFIAPHMGADSFYSVNGMLPASKINGKPRLPTGAESHPSMRRAVWGSDKLRWLTACWCDLDYYNIPGMTLGRAVGHVIDLEEEGLIPHASMLVDSGRGLWAFWVLRDDKRHDQPVRAWPETTATWHRIMRELQRRLKGIEPDLGATDGPRVTRVPGSTNTKSGRRVRWWVQGDESGPYSYRMDELAAFLNVRPTRLPQSVQRELDPAKREAGKRGYAALNRRRLERAENLLAVRGKINDGCRHRFCSLLAYTMTKCGMPREEIAARVFEVGTELCDPPLPDDEISDAMRQGAKWTKITDHKIGDWLLITPDEAELVGWPAKGAHDHTMDQNRTRADRRSQRRSLIGHLIERAGGEVPTLEVIADFLDEHGAEASVATIRLDLIRMGIENPRARTEINENGQHLLT